jgi:hypothetical protein
MNKFTQPFKKIIPEYENKYQKALIKGIYFKNKPYQNFL